MAAALLSTLFFLGLVAVGDDVPKPPPVLLLLDAFDFFGLLFFLEALSLVRWEDDDTSTSLVMGGERKDLGRDVMNVVVC